MPVIQFHLVLSLTIQWNIFDILRSSNVRYMLDALAQQLLLVASIMIALLLLLLLLLFVEKSTVG